MKHTKITLKRLAEFAESYDVEIINTILLSVILALTISIPIILNKICWAFCAPLALILVYVIVRGILDLISSYRWYFGIPKKIKRKTQNNDLQNHKRIHRNNTNPRQTTQNAD